MAPNGRRPDVISLRARPAIVIGMADTSPLVTVGMAVYNGEKYIREAVAAVLDQTFHNWELLAFSDASPDRSVAAIREFADSRIRIIESHVNIGLVGVRNAIMAEARGKYVAWLDQDDLCAPGRLEAQVSFLEANTSYAMCGSWAEMRTELPDGTVSSAIARYPLTYPQVRSAILFMNPIASSTSTLRLSAFADSGLEYRTEFGNSLDYDMWSQASDRMPICNLPLVLGTHRVHGSQTSQGEALARMHAHAIAIQRDLARRALLLDMTDDDCHWHQLATVSPIAISDPAELTRISQWFGRLRAANGATRAFETAEFDRALSRQWTSVVLAALRAAGSTTSALQAGVKGFRTIGVGKRDIGASLAAGVRRRFSRLA